MRREMSSYDVVLDVSEGDSFATIYGWKRFAKMVTSKVAAGRSDATLVLCPQTLGPWESPIARSSARWAARRAVCTWARDTESVERAKAAGLRDVALSSDLAFAQSMPKGAEHDIGYDVLLNVSGLLWSPNRHVDHSDYRQLVRRLIRQVLDADLSLGLVPHVVAPGQTDDDVEVAHDLASEWRGTEVVTSSTLAHLRAVMRQSRLLVGSRMHACLNALSVGTPAVALGYSDKFSSLFADLAWEHVVDLRFAGQTFALDLPAMLSTDVSQAAERSREIGRRKVECFLREVSEL
jgi:polysaccharide pyruvyl transferase WcaK-like protein